MKRGRTLILLAVALVALGAAVGVVAGRQRLFGPGTTTVTGVVGSEKIRFLRDPEVVRALAGHGIALDLEAEGSRRMSTMDLGRFDFAFPGSAPTATRVAQRRTPVRDGYTPFSSPLAVATFSPFTELGRKVGDLLTTDPRLQDLAARHGFRTADPTRFQPVLTKVRSGDAPLPVALTDLVAPPGPDALETLLNAVEERLT